VEEPLCGAACQGLAGDPPDRLGTPEGAHIRENLRAIGQEVAEQHRERVQRVVLRGEDVRLADAGPIERGVQDSLGKIAVREVIRPLALPLKAGGQGVVPHRLFGITHLRQAGVARHQIPGDQGHLDHRFPVLVQFRARGALLRRVQIWTFRAVGFDPGQGAAEFLLVIDLLVEPTHELGHVHVLAAHAEIVFEKIRIDHRAGNAHRHRAHGQVRSPAHRGHGQPGFGELQQPGAHILRYGRIRGVLDVPPIDAKGGQPFLAVRGEDCSQVDGPRALRAVQAPDGFGHEGIHVHRLRAVTPAGRDAQRDADALARELGRGHGRFGDASDACIGDHALYRKAVRVAQVLAEQPRCRARHAHRLLFQALPDSPLTGINHRPDPYPRITYCCAFTHGLLYFLS